jgi:hypothetical protein
VRKPNAYKIGDFVSLRGSKHSPRRYSGLVIGVNQDGVRIRWPRTGNHAGWTTGYFYFELETWEAKVESYAQA